MNPLVDFTRNLIRCKFELRYTGRVFLYYIKFSFFEPFRIYEKIFWSKKVKEFNFSRPPVFILGYYRSGTTHLQETLLQDPQFGYMNFYQCFFPTAFNSSEKIFKKPFNFIVRLIRLYHPAHQIPFHFDLPGEEDVALVSSGHRLAPNWGQVFPRFFKEFFNKNVFFDEGTKQEHDEFEDYLINLYKRVALANGKNKTMLFKSPPQTARVEMILKYFPDAKIIYIHRNPYEVYKSNLNLWRSFEGQNLHRPPSKDYVDDCIAWSYRKCLKFYHDNKDKVPKNNLVEVSFEELQKDPLQTLKNIYDVLKIGEFSDVEPLFSSYLKEKHGKNNKSYTYSDEEIKFVKNHLIQE